MSVQKTLEDFFSARTTTLAPTPKHFYVRLAALTTHGGFMSVLPLVVEFLVCGEPLRELELHPEMKEYEERGSANHDSESPARKRSISGSGDDAA